MSKVGVADAKGAALDAGCVKSNLIPPLPIECGWGACVAGFDANVKVLGVPPALEGCPNVDGLPKPLRTDCDGLDAPFNPLVKGAELCIAGIDGLVSGMKRLSPSSTVSLTLRMSFIEPLPQF